MGGAWSTSKDGPCPIEIKSEAAGVLMSKARQSGQTEQFAGATAVERTT